MKFEEVTPKYLGELKKDDDISFMREFTFDQKVELMKQILLQEDILNSALILNVITIINGLSDTDDNFFENKDLIYTSIEEYVDLKLELKNEINVYRERVVLYYIGIIKGLTVKLDDIRIHVPNNYWNYFLGSTVNDVSKIFVDYNKSVDFSKVPPVFCADILFGGAVSQQNLFTDFIRELSKTVEGAK